MKKIIKITFILFLCVILSSCGEKKEYKLIELNSADLLTNLISEEKPDFIFATVNSNNNNHKEFMESLEALTTKARLNIYYVDYNHMDHESSLFLLDNIPINFHTSGYHVYKDGEIVLTRDYTNYVNLYNDLKNFSSIDKLTITEDDKLIKNIDKAKKEYENGHIGLAYNYLSLAWPLKEAKDMYNNYNYFNLINNWEVYKFDDISLTNVTYKNIIFMQTYKYYLEITKSDKYENFVKPDSLMKYERVYYYVKDDIIYTSKDDNKYTATYEIISLSSKIFHIKDLKTKEEYEYIRGV